MTTSEPEYPTSSTLLTSLYAREENFTGPVAQSSAIHASSNMADYPDAVAQGSVEACLAWGQELSRQAASCHQNFSARDQFNRAAMLFLTGLILQNENTTHDLFATTIMAMDDATIVDSGFSSSVEDQETHEIVSHQPEGTRLTKDLINALTHLQRQSLISSHDPSYPLPNLSSPLHKAVVNDAIRSMNFSTETLPNPATLTHHYAKKLHSHLPRRSSRARRTPFSASDDDMESILTVLINAYESPSIQTASPSASLFTRELSPIITDFPHPTSDSSKEGDASKSHVPFPSHGKFPRRLDTGESRGTSRTRASSLLSSTSTQSTSPSILLRLRCDSGKSNYTTSLTPVEKSTMGSFTPVPAKTAVGSLKPFARQSERPSFRSRLGLKARHTIPAVWDDESDKTEAESDDTDWNAALSPPAQSRSRRRSIPNRPTIPSLSLTHSSFISPSPMSSCIPTPLHSQTAQHSPIATQASMHCHRRTNSDGGALAHAAGVHARGMPALDPTLAALEKACRLKGKVRCAMCGSVGFDFPRSRTGEALCGKDCRLRWREASLTTRRATPRRSFSAVL